MEKLKDAWVLKLKEEMKDETMIGDYYYQDQGYAEFLTQDLSESTIIDSKEEAIAEMKAHESIIVKQFGEGAICNGGYTSMMQKFEWVEVEVIEDIGEG